MINAYDNLLRITSPTTTREQRLLSIRDFAQALDWTPSYEFHGSYGVPAAEDHIVVEHGLENSAILSFLRAPARAAQLDLNQIRMLLTISYNNLIDWHIFVSETEVSFVNNRTETYAENIQPLTRTNHADLLSATQFERSVAHTPIKPAYQNCDDTLISVLSRWKRLIKADYRERVENRNISALFNSIILVRGCEDNQQSTAPKRNRVLLDLIISQTGSEIDLREIISLALKNVGIDQPLSTYVSARRLEPFRKFDRATALDLMRDFYCPLSSVYDFNFALMSKHALSRIYERYVSLLEFDEGEEGQLSFIPPVPTERSHTKAGTVYTPQYIAGFFSRYLKENLTPRTFRDLKVIDPACGSGIFLRTLLELQANPFVPGTTLQTITAAFESVTGIDRDPNACEAAFLSLALLYLVATGRLPKALDIRNKDAISLALEGRLEAGGFDAVLANPPYIKRDNLSSGEQSSIAQFLAPHEFGRADSYLAFVKLCLDSVREDGFVCLVLPQAFMFAKNARFLRELIGRGFYIRCLVDLSLIRVFEGVGTYIILLIVQKRSGHADAPPAQVARVQEFVGPALQACLERQPIDTPYYSVFDVPQAYFKPEAWVLLGPSDVALQKRLTRFNPISHYLEVKQGFLSGADGIFVIDKKNIPVSEKEIYADYLPDRMIRRYAVPLRVNDAVFYPYVGGEQLDEADLKRNYPKTWRYLLSHRKELEARRSVASGDTLWWRPVRPRDPKTLMRPKIVCPHLMLTPRFAIDLRGRYAVSHTPFLVTREPAEEALLLKFFCAVLNSSVCNWYLSMYSPRYGRGYKRLEVASLKTIPVPDPADVPTRILKRIIDLVDDASKTGASREIETSIDKLVCELYGVSPAELGQFQEIS